MTDQSDQQNRPQPDTAPLSEAERLHYLQLMGIQPWFERQPAVADQSPEPDMVTANDSDTDATRVDSAETAEQPSVDRPSDGQPVVADVGSMDWEQLRTAVSQCQLCELHSTRTQTVFGVGDAHADLLIVGEAPGAEEDRQGEPFVGRAGKLLDAMLAAIELDRRQVFIANVLKCRPPNNRDPRTSEIVCCDAYLQRQIELIQPKAILALGRIAAHHLLVSQDSLGKMRQRQHSYNGIPLLVSYHPAYLLRNPVDKRKSWHDLIQIKKVLGQL